MSIYDIILSNIEDVLQSLMSNKNPEDYINILKLIEIIYIIRR